jgi:hypothetical protein
VEFAPEESIPITRGRPVGRTVTDRQTVHVHDLAAEIDGEFPESSSINSVLEHGPFFLRLFCARLCLSEQ